MRGTRCCTKPWNGPREQFFDGSNGLEPETAFLGLYLDLPSHEFADDLPGDRHLPPEYGPPLA